MLLPNVIKKCYFQALKNVISKRGKMLFPSVGKMLFPSVECYFQA